MPAALTRVMGLLYLPVVIGAASLWCAFFLSLICGLLWLIGTLFGAHLLGWLTFSRFALTNVIGGFVLFSVWRVRTAMAQTGKPAAK